MYCFVNMQHDIVQHERDGTTETDYEKMEKNGCNRRRGFAAGDILPSDGICIWRQ